MPLAVYSLITMGMQLFLALSLRMGYSIDIISGLLFAHYFWILAERHSHHIDVRIFRLSANSRKLTFVQACPACQEPLDLYAIA